MITRPLQTTITQNFFTGKIIIIYGARQVGKTTLSKQILASCDDGLYLNCEHQSVQQGLAYIDPLMIKKFFGNAKIIVLDEAQVIADIGRKLKVMIDAYPEIQIIATGSSAFDLANHTSEPLTGRAYIYTLHPLSFYEITLQHGLHHTMQLLPYYLRFGMYPEIISSDIAHAEQKLLALSSSYLYKDILMIESIQKSPILDQLLKLLAFQIGNEVSYSELATKLGISRPTIIKYIDILEKLFIIVKVGSRSRNLRNELHKSIKIYFWDIGIRNAIINSFADIEYRSDTGAVRENFCIIEQIKKNTILGHHYNYYFWRTYTQQEIDLIAQKDDFLQCFEYKYSEKKKAKIPDTFVHAYPHHSFDIVNQSNYYMYIG